MFKVNSKNIKYNPFQAKSSLYAYMYLFNVNNRKTRKSCEICSKLPLTLLLTLNTFHTFFKCFYCC